MRILRLLAAVVIIFIVGVIALLAFAWRSEIDPVEAETVEEFDDELIAEGARLAALGNCVDCHTAPGGAPYAGGYAMDTPYGTIYGTNITPDPETGIGEWPEAAFVRAMREGVSREGRHLYPAFPYDQFVRTTDEDLRAIYAYLMTREPVRHEAPSPDVPFPLQFRPLLAGWKLLFHNADERFEPDPDQTAEWNHGAYLVDGLAHCGACHTPRNAFGAREEEENYLAGGESEDWYAPPLNEQSPAPISWDSDSLAQYLGTGISADHAAAAGPMAPVVRSLAQVPQEDVTAMAIYVADQMGAGGDAAQAEEGEQFAATETGTAAEATNEAAEDHAAATLYEGACAACHEPTGALYFSAQVDLENATSIEYADPRNVINVLLDGIEQPLQPGQPLMPGFATGMTDEQIASVAAYLRERFSDEPAWGDTQALMEEVGRIREEQRDREAHYEVTAGDPVEEPDE